MSADVGRRLHVLLAAPASTGGIGRHVGMLAAGLAERGHLVTVAAPEATLALVPAGDGISRVPMALGGRHPWRAGAALRRLAGNHDVVHAHGVRVGAQAALARVGPLVTTWHNAPIGSRLRRGTHRVLEGISARGSRVVVGASGDLVERARRAGARDCRLGPVAAPVTASVLRRGVPELPTILAVARLHPQKRLDLLVDATAGWLDEPGRPRVLVAGDGPLRSSLEAHARRVRSSVQFLGPRSDVPELLAGADVVVLPSDWEARPLVAQESLRAGVPLVATDVGGVRDLVGDAAVLVPAGDAVALGAALTRVLTDPALREELAAAGPRRAATWPTAQDMVSQIEQIFLDLQQTSRP